MPLDLEILVWTFRVHATRHRIEPNQPSDYPSSTLRLICISLKIRYQDSNTILVSFLRKPRFLAFTFSLFQNPLSMLQNLGSISYYGDPCSPVYLHLFENTQPKAFPLVRPSFLKEPFPFFFVFPFQKSTEGNTICLSITVCSLRFLSKILSF